jgi:hypothetical protein
MQPDFVVIEFPSLPVSRIEALAQRILDAVQQLWIAGRLRGVLSSDIGRAALEGFLSSIAEGMSQTYTAEQAGRTATRMTVHLPRTAARDVVAFASAVTNLLEDEQTMRSVGGTVLDPEDSALMRELIMHAAIATGSLLTEPN